MRVAIIAIILICALPSCPSARTMRLGPFELGMSPHEAAAAARGAMRFETPTRGGSTRAEGAVEMFGAEFTVSAGFYWNTGMRTLSILHRGVEDDQACRALAAASAAEVERGLGLEAPDIPQERTPWYAGRDNYDDVDSIWDVNWYAGGSTGECVVGVRVSAGPIPVPDPMSIELADVSWISGSATWLLMPTREQVLAAYPAEAKRLGFEGEVDLACRVRLEGGGLRCMVLETRGWSFGDAALDLAETYYRIAPVIDGEHTAGRQLRLRIEFRNPRELPQLD